jgi:hypothetical protein
MSGVGKTTAARTFARRHDLWLYSLDARSYEHDAQLPDDGKTLDERWVDTTPEKLADWFEDYSRRRFALVLDDLTDYDDGAPILVDGPQLLPDLVGEHSLFVVASPELQRELVVGRGSDLYARTRDPERALENRLGRDVVLAQRLAADADVVTISDVNETAAAVEARFLPVISDWVARSDHGDVVARRRAEEDARERQRRAHMAHVQRHSA